MDKKCYCINPSCKCLFGCGCTLADKSVGKCMCCIMEETNQKIDKLRRRKTTTIPSGNLGGKYCECKKLGDSIFYDIIVVDGSNYVSCRYGCSVTIKEGFEIAKDNWQKDYITGDYLTSITANEINDDMIYNLKNGEELYQQLEPPYYLLFVDKSTLMYAAFFTSTQPIPNESAV